MRIISLVPSFTKTLVDLGLSSSEIVGRTKFCIHPGEIVNQIPKMGGTKNLDLDKIRSLKPDLILASKEENEREQIENLQKDFDVWVTDIQTFSDSLDFLLELGQKLGKEQKALEISQEIEDIFSSLPKLNLPTVTYLIWKDPYLSVGKDTFIHSLLEKLGFTNSQSGKQRYPELSLEDIGKSSHLFLSSEPYPFAEKHQEELQARFAHLQIHLVNGEAFSWYGSHLKEFDTYYKELIKEVTSV